VGTAHHRSIHGELVVTAPVVSVVLPAYNAADTVGEAVASILDQRLQELELIVVDDGSTDATRAVLEKFDDPRLVVLHHPTNRGFGAALRTGIENTTTDVIARLDADDVAHTDRLAREYEVLQQRPEVGLVTTAYFIVDESGRELERRDTPPDHASAWFRLLFGNQFGHSTTMYRRAIYNAVGGYRDEYYPSEDHDLWLLMAEVTEVAMIPDPLLWYRQLDSSMSAQLKERMETASVAASSSALERITGQRPSERILRGFRPPYGLTCRDADDVLDVVLPAYVAVRKACRKRGISTRRLRAEFARRLIRGGFANPKGSWCVAGLLRLFVRRPWTASAVVLDRAAARVSRLRAARV
jgi:glycosyltransferase involved in cell wall biosynthesis